ncbi:hypothetical protein RI845_16575 [Thalassotalea nanhaiensis]|uniref:DUF6701 domain-containing protein n=1 Tax=Thalassotalea nanhaiensis TaxID=3065648 RepID=A0ABY9THB7_9GAMM|nr:hypothetical protein RI845_16575 [Colwelliaceae bacterium SQ345]
MVVNNKYKSNVAIYFLGLALMLLIQNVYATCSPYIGEVTINEVYRIPGQGNNPTTGFIEVKIIGEDLDAFPVNTWQLSLCDSTNTCELIPLTNAGKLCDDCPWIFLAEDGIDPQEYNAELVDFTNGFDLRLLDENGADVDYLTVNGVLNQFPVADCPYPYPKLAISDNSTKSIHRIGDGTGFWVPVVCNSPSCSSPGDGNDDPSFPYLIIDSVEVTQGETATLTVSMVDKNGNSTTFDQIVSFDFRTEDGTALVDDHYIGRVDTFNIFIGESSTEVEVDSVLVPDLVTRYFQGVVFGSSAANVGEGISDITILPATLSGIYQIKHDGQGLTCEAEPIEIIACTDATCTTIDTSITTDVILSVNGVGQTVSIVDGISDNASFVHVDPITPAILSLSDDYLCLNTSDNSDSCQLTFADAGFVLEALDATSCLSTQVLIKAVKKDEVTKQCVGALVGNKNINFSFNYSNPITGSTLPSINGVDMAVAGVDKSFVVNFNSNSAAIINDFNYRDSGLLALNANYVESSGDLSGLVLNGSEDILFYPAKLTAVATTSSALPLDGSNTEKSGLAFNLSVEAQCADGSITENYLPETNNSIEINSKRLAPIDPILGGDGTLTFNNVTQLASTTDNWRSAEILPASFNLGQFTDSAAIYSEVGTLSVEFRDSNYQGMMITGDAISVGDFTPHHFEQISDPNVQGTLTTLCNAYAYTGQMVNAAPTLGAIHYLVNPELRITPKNAQGVITKNYINEFMAFPLQSADITDEVNIDAPTSDASQLGSQNTLLAVSAQLNNGVFVPKTEAVDSGIVNYQLSTLDDFVYVRDQNSLVSPFIAELEFNVNEIKDSNGISTTYTDLSGSDISSVENTTVTDIEIRFARWRIQNSFGPETSNLTQPMQLQYFDEGSFVVAENGNCTIVDQALMSLSRLTLDPTSVVGGISTFTEGENRSLQIVAPGVGNQGEMNVTYDVPTWFKFDWSGINDGTFTENPTAVATFGRYNNSGRIINKREIDK